MDIEEFKSYINKPVNIQKIREAVINQIKQAKEEALQKIEEFDLSLFKEALLKEGSLGYEIYSHPHLNNLRTKDVQDIEAAIQHRFGDVLKLAQVQGTIILALSPKYIQEKLQLGPRPIEWTEPTLEDIQSRYRVEALIHNNDRSQMMTHKKKVNNELEQLKKDVVALWLNPGPGGPGFRDGIKSFTEHFEEYERKCKV